MYRIGSHLGAGRGIVGQQLAATTPLKPACTSSRVQQRSSLSLPGNFGPQRQCRRSPAAILCSSSSNSSSNFNGGSFGSGSDSSSSGFGQNPNSSQFSNSMNPNSDSVDLCLSIISASSWQQLYDLFHDHRNMPSYQHCYGMLMQLADLLPEMQQQPRGPAAAAAAQASSAQQPQPSSSGNTAAELSEGGFGGAAAAGDGGSWEAVWQALTAGGKITSWTQLTRLRALIRDVLRAIQVQLHLFTPQELLEVWEAATALAQPSELWIQAWEAALQPSLKLLQLSQLMRAGAGLLSYGHNPSKPWAGLWFVALQVHLPHCTSQQLCLISIALKHWGCKPPLSWTEPYMEAVQANMAQMTTPELLAVLGACVSLGLKPSPAWLQGFEGASQGLLGSCSPSELALLLQGLQLLGHSSPSQAWLQAYLAAVHAGLRGWEVETLGTMLLGLGQLPAGREAVQLHDSSSSSSNYATSSSGVGGEAAASAAGLLPAIAAHAEPLLEATGDAGVLVRLLRGFYLLNFTPSDEWLDLLLDEAAEKITMNSAVIRQQFYPGSSSMGSSMGSSRSSSGGSSRGRGALDGQLGPAGGASPSATRLDSSSGSRSGSGSSGSGSGSSSSGSESSGAWLDGSGEDDEQPWLLQAGSYQPDRNINLARKKLETSWSISSRDSSSSSVTSSSNPRGWNGSISSSSSSNIKPSAGLNGASQPLGFGAAGPPAAAAAGLPGLAASRVVVGHVLGLLSVVAAMELPVEKVWVADVLRALQGHCRVIDVPELQQLLLLVEEYGVVLEPDRLDELLVQSHVDYRHLRPQDQLRLLSLLAASETRPNNIWWQSYLATLQDTLHAHSPAQLVLLLTSLCEMGGRPPQAWLAAHESALLDCNASAPSAAALRPEGWLLLLECYAKLMYCPSEAFEGAFERYFTGVLYGLSARGLASLVGSVARLQLPCSPQLEEGIIARLEQVLPRATSEELQQLVQGLLLLDVQLPSSCLHNLCELAQPYLASFSPQATCSMLQLLAVAGDYPPSPAWLAEALSGLQPQLDSLEALGALMLLQSLKAFHAQPEELVPGFMAALQQRLLVLLPKFDAMGVAMMMQGLAAASAMPSAELQLVLAGHIKKGLARPSQGMGATPVWLLLEVVLEMHDPPAVPALLDELLHQVGQQLSQQGTVSSSRMVQRLLPLLAAAITQGGVWGPSRYTPNSDFCATLCTATLEDPARLDALLWLDLLVRFGDMPGFKPSDAWVQAAMRQVFGSWGEQQWQAAPGDQLAALLGVAGRLQHMPVHLPGWPAGALSRLQAVLGDLDGHEMSVALVGVAQQQQLAEMADVAGAALLLVTDGSTDSSSSRDGVSSSSSSRSSSSSSKYSSTLQGIAASKPQLLQAAEAASSQQLQSMCGDDLAVLGHALQQLGHTPCPAWVSSWSAAAARQLPGASAQAGVLLLTAAAGFQARPDPTWLQLLLDHCQQHLQHLQLQELVALAAALQMLGFKLDEGFVQGLVKAGRARVQLGAGVEVYNGGALGAVPGGASMIVSRAGAAAAASSPAEAAVRQQAYIEMQQVLTGLLAC